MSKQKIKVGKKVPAFSLPSTGNKILNLSEDDLKRKINEIQKITDSNIDKIDKILEAKKIDILKV